MLPREIQTENWPDRAKYDLPIRPIGLLHWVGILPIAFAVAFIGIPAKFGSQLLQRAIHGSGPIEWVAVAFLAVFIVAAMTPLRLGLFILAGRVRLVATKEKLIITEIAGPFRWSRKLRFGDIERIEVGARNAGNPGPPAAGAGLMQLGGLSAVMKNGSKRLLAIGYPSDWLSALAEELSEVSRRTGAAVPVQEVSMSLRPTNPPAQEQSQTQPPQSSARLVTTVGGIELTAPSRGIFKESSGLVWLGIFWCGVIGVVTLAFLFGHPPSARHASLGKMGTTVILGLFWAVGLGLLSFGIHLGTRRWTVQADKSSLKVFLRSALRKREWQWQAGEIQKVEVGNSNMEVNHRPLEELQVFSRSGKKTGLLLGRDHAELVWMATVIREALGSTASPESPQNAT